MIEDTEKSVVLAGRLKTPLQVPVARILHRLLHRVFPSAFGTATFREAIVTDRRSFVSTVSAAGLWLARPDWTRGLGTALQVSANPTVFFAQPDGVRNLVRFEVNGIDAPAGRLRVFDRSRRLLGTMGVLRVGERLYGELWMELEDTTSVVSELEAPGVRGPFRTTHRLTPERRWTIHLMTVADPNRVAGALNDLRPINRAVQTAVYRNSSVTLNPLPISSALSGLEHIPFLRLAGRALEVERECAIPMGTAAYVPPGMHLPRSGALALAGAGVRVLAREQVGGDPYEWWELPGGTRLLVVSVPDGSTPGALGFDLPQVEMIGRVEDWIASTALRFSPENDVGTAVVLNSEFDEAFTATLATISNWNSRFAYPRIVVGNNAVLFDDMETRAMGTTASSPVAIRSPQMPAGADLAGIAKARASQATDRTNNLARVLGSVVEIGANDLDGVAAHIATAVGGTVVFNPSPYAHSDLVQMSDGSERLATNVPGLGYAFFPDESVIGEVSRWEPIRTTYSAEGEEFQVAIDRSTGAISSLKQLSDGRDWVRSGSDGLNLFTDARLVGVSATQLPGVATRLVVIRRSPSLGTITTTVTLYDELPWLRLSNEAETARAAEIPYRFEFGLNDPHVSWEVPAGYEESAEPVPVLEHLRWIRLTDTDGALLIRGFDAPLASLDADGTLTSYAPGSLSRYRLAPISRYSSQDQPWVFGWDAEAMAVVRAEPNGSGVLPRFGSLVTVEKVGVTVLGIVPASDGYGAIVYLQETLGVARDISIAPGVLRFDYAETVDYLERYKDEVFVRPDGAIDLPMPAHGVVAVRLSGIALS